MSTDWSEAVEEIRKNVRIRVILDEFDFRNWRGTLKVDIQGLDPDIANRYIPTFTELTTALGRPINGRTVLFPHEFRSWLSLVIDKLELPKNRETIKRILKVYLETWLTNIRNAVKRGEIIGGGVEYSGPIAEFNIESFTLPMSTPPVLILGDKLYYLEPAGDGNLDVLVKQYAGQLVNAMKTKVAELERTIEELGQKIPLDDDTIHRFIRAGLRVAYVDVADHLRFVIYLPKKFKTTKVKQDDLTTLIPADWVDKLPYYYPGVIVKRTSGGIRLTPVILDTETLKPLIDHPNVSRDDEVACTNIEPPVWNANPDNLKAYLQLIGETMTLINYDSSYHSGHGAFDGLRDKWKEFDVLLNEGWHEEESDTSDEEWEDEEPEDEYDEYDDDEGGW